MKKEHVLKSMSVRKDILTLGSIPLLICSLVFSCAINLPSGDYASTYYVSTDGDDSYNGLYPSFQGGDDGPFRTLGAAAAFVRAGDIVQIRGGTYQEASTWNANGTKANPITVTNYNDERVIIDGDNHTLPRDEYGVLLKIKGDWYNVSNLEICFSSCYGLVVQETAEHCTIQNCYAHHNWHSGITLHGSYGLIENCRAFYNSQWYEWCVGEPGAWSSGIAVCRAPSYATIRGCTAWNNWGQGIDTYECYYATVEDCVSYDNMFNFYISDTKFCLFQRNLSYCSTNNIVGQCMNGIQVPILMGDETKNPPSSDNTVINNLVMGGERNISIGTGVFENGLVANNTFVNASNTAGSESANIRIGRGTYTRARFVNNIIYQDDAVNMGINDATGVTLGYNIWSQTPHRNCLGPEDLIADPQLAKAGGTGPGLLTPEWFKILEDSPARNKGILLSEVQEDFFKTSRGIRPDIGAHEIPYQSDSPAGTRMLFSQTVWKTDLLWVPNFPGPIRTLIALAHSNRPGFITHKLTKWTN